MNLKPIQILFRQPLFHFFILGGGIFLISHMHEKKKIRLSAAEINELAAAQANILKVPGLSESGRKEIIARAVDDELLYREALSRGLDRDDHVVKQRLAQKLLFIEQASNGSFSEPTDESILQYFDKKKSKWQIPESISFIHVFKKKFDPLEFSGLQVQLGKGSKHDEIAPNAGDQFSFSRTVTKTSISDVEQIYGTSFAKAVSEQKPDVWIGPIESKYGWHIVKVLEKSPMRDPAFTEVAGKVRFDFFREKTHQATESLFKKLYAKYDIEIDGCETPIDRSFGAKYEDSEDED